MDSLTITLAVLGALGGGAGGFGLHMIRIFGDLIGAGAQVVAPLLGVHTDKAPAYKEPASLATYVATGAVVGALALGSVPALHRHFTGAAEPAAPHQATMAECVRKAPAVVSKIEIETQPDGSKVCHYTP